jgi:hypothetical protein
MKKIFIHNLIVFFSLTTFLFSTTHFSLHQLEHLNEIVCLSKDAHYHTTEHNHFCKDLSFFVFNDLSNDSYSIVKYTSIFFHYQKEFNYSYSYNFSLNSRGPPFLVN